jgi:uncharacterized protein (DUF488 family)
LDTISGPTELGTLYTFGYGKLKGPDDLAALIDGERIDVVLDVRYVPTGRNPLWRPGLVAETIHKGGIPEYIHVKALGNPDFRSGLPATRVFNEEEGMGLLMDVLASGRNAALMCVCADTPHCHRRLIVAKARQLRPDLRLVELEVGKAPQRA